MLTLSTVGALQRRDIKFYRVLCDVYPNHICQLYLASAINLVALRKSVRYLNLNNKIRMNQITLTDSDRQFFYDNGYLVVSCAPLIQDQFLINQLKSQFEKCFRGQFSTGIYPDEWHWRAGISNPGVVREICNAWKSDDVIRSVVLSPEIGSLGGQLYPHWTRVRVAQDDVIWKGPQSTVKGHIGYHVDSAYISRQFEAPETELKTKAIKELSERYNGHDFSTGSDSITVWIALDDADEENGALEYVERSHLLFGMRNTTKSFGVLSESDEFAEAHKKIKDMLNFHTHAENPDEEKERFVAALNEVINKNKNSLSMDSLMSIVKPQVPAGFCLIHHQNMLHGSGGNISMDRHRRALAVHLIDGDVKFVGAPTYIYGRYKLQGSVELRDEFFPVTWTRKE